MTKAAFMSVDAIICEISGIVWMENNKLVVFIVYYHLLQLLWAPLFCVRVFGVCAVWAGFGIAYTFILFFFSQYRFHSEQTFRAIWFFLRLRGHDKRGGKRERELEMFN